MRRTAAPLPECRMCETPTRRQTFERTGGFCSDCSDGIAETVKMLPVPRQLPPAPDDLTAYVEQYRPPVPPGPGLRLIPGGKDAGQ